MAPAQLVPPPAVDAQQGERVGGCVEGHCAGVGGVMCGCSLVWVTAQKYETIGCVSVVLRSGLCRRNVGCGGMLACKWQRRGCSGRLKLRELDGNFGGAVLLAGGPRPRSIRDLLSYTIDIAQFGIGNESEAEHSLQLYGEKKCNPTVLTRDCSDPYALLCLLMSAMSSPRHLILQLAARLTVSPAPLTLLIPVPGPRASGSPR